LKRVVVELWRWRLSTVAPFWFQNKDDKNMGEQTDSPQPESCLWCCGSLHTASVAVGVANLVTVIILIGHYVESTMVNGSFSLEVVALLLVALFLAAASMLMIYGSVKKYSWLLLPWLILHFAAVVGSVVFWSIKFHDLRGDRAVPVLGTAIQSYFLLLIFAQYQLLRKLNIEQARDQESGLEDGAKKNKCLIDLEVMEEKPDDRRSAMMFSNDDTFTQLAMRGNNCLDDSAELQQAEAQRFIPTHRLPTPDEVIMLPEEEEEQEVNLSAAARWQSEDSTSNSAVTGEDQIDNIDQGTVIPRRTTSKSVANLDKNGSTGALLQPLLPPAKSEPKIMSSATGLTQVANNFSPFRSKSAAQNGPKMKIFLPRTDDDCDDTSSSSSEDNDEVDVTAAVAASNGISSPSKAMSSSDILPEKI
jgi:hypothetical protein